MQILTQWLGVGSESLNFTGSQVMAMVLIHSPHVYYQGSEIPSSHHAASF